MMNEPNAYHIPPHPQSNLPRRSYSTITGPTSREIANFYEPQYRAKFAHPNDREQIIENQPLQKDEISFDPMRFSPPNFTPPPPPITSIPSTSFEQQRFNDELPSYPNNGFYQPNMSHRFQQIPPRKCSLAPNFFSTQNSHHVYPDQYTPRNWQTNEFMTPMTNNYMNQGYQQKQEQNGWQQQYCESKYPLEVKQQPAQTQPVEIGSYQSSEIGRNGVKVHTDMLSPIAMEIDNEQTKKSPFGNGDGGLNAHKRSHPNVPSRKASIMALKSQLRTPRIPNGNSAFSSFVPSPRNVSNNNIISSAASVLTSSAATATAVPYTPPPILAPMRNGSGLFCSIAKSAAAATSAQPSGSDESRKQKKSEDGDGPSRKNGLFYMAQQMNQPNFADELEQLRKESWASTSSHEAPPTRKPSQEQVTRKLSCVSDTYYDLDGPQSSDPNPHINIGKEYQAKVRKWNDREVHQSELDAIEDRDEMVFSCRILDDIDPEQITAFELLACSQACPRAGHNKELALHLLMENNGNIEAAVEDLLRCDTLDWEHYDIVYNYSYNDTSTWSPDEVYQFQDAIYKSEKDFDKVAQELPGKTIRECVQFYYTWKKACPDDYRKLRNLRRKRRLLEMNLQQMDDVPIPMKKCSLQESIESDIDSDATAATPTNLSGLVNEFRDRAFTSPIIASPRESPLVGGSPISKDLQGLQRNYQPLGPRQHNATPANPANKKGAQPSADGFFHCRLCDKCFEKVKSLNAHMKSHAMKARAEQEAKAHDAQLAAAAAAAQLTNSVNTSSPLTPTNPFNAHLGGISLSQSLSLNQQLQSQLNSLSNQLTNGGAASPLTPQQQLHQLTQHHQQIVARAMQQSLFQQQNGAGLNGLAAPAQTSPLLQAGLHTIH